MSGVRKDRLTFMVNPERKVIVIRPIGALSARSFIDQKFERYAEMDAPWTYNRLVDFRRFDGFLENGHLQEIADRWAALVAGKNTMTCVAIVSLDAFDRVHVPAISPMFAHETVCHFSDFHEGMGWLMAPDRPKFLNNLTPVLVTSPKDSRILVE